MHIINLLILIIIRNHIKNYLSLYYILKLFYMHRYILSKQSSKIIFHSFQLYIYIYIYINK